MSGPDTDPNATPGLFPVPPLPEQERMIEAILFASAVPVPMTDIARRLPEGCDPAEAVRRLRDRYAGRGVEVVRAGDAWAIRTAPDLAWLLHTETQEQKKLSRAAIETLAIVAYHQPVTRTEIEEIRGVGLSRGTLDQLIELGWVRLGRRRQTPGRPVTFVTTETFLDHFGLESARDLPGLAELRAAGLLDARPQSGSVGAGGATMGTEGTEGTEGGDMDAPQGQSEFFED